MKIQLLTASFLLTISLLSCVKKDSVDNPVPIVPTDPVTKTMKDLVIPASFDFQTTKEVALSVLVKNASSNLTGIPVSVYLNYPGPSISPNTNANLVGTFLSLEDGRIDTKIKVPVSQDSLYLTTNYLGLESESGFQISGLTASYTYGQGNNIKSIAIPKELAIQPKAAITYTYMGTFNSQGVPNYLEKTDDAISQGLLNDINASLPEYKSIPTSHPQYLIKGREGDVVITEKADIWITFVGEGAGYLNAIGYYTYNSNNAPKNRSEIAKFNVIFPNSSLQGSGGGLKSGNKVKLGTFDAGTTIGWFIVAYGWNGSNAVTGQTLYFSDPSLNLETNASKRQHTVLIHDVTRQLFLLGFEDLNRDSGSDDDFNDAIFYVTANPARAIDGTLVPVIDTPQDDDKDGVTNNSDEYPKDPLRARTNYYPGKDQYNSLLVEDLWPSLGDFDFNDLVIDATYKQVTNGKGNVVEEFIKLKVKAIGATFRNGFGIQFPIAPTEVASVTLTDQTGAVKSIGVEAGQDKTVIIAFDDAYKLLPSVGGSGVNVVKANGWSEPKDIELHILFSTPQTAANLGTAPFNTFITINVDRTKEVHLPNAKPTSKANVALLGTGADTSNPATGRYYKSANNLVWMLEVPSGFQYAIEKNDITKVYTKFAAWAESGGSLYKDWYMDKTGYRESSLIYTK